MNATGESRANEGFPLRVRSSVLPQKEMQQSEQDEERVRLYLIEFGLRPERFTKPERRLRKTPDFRIFKGNTLQLFCEVKTIERDSWINDQAEITVAPGVKVSGGRRPDPTSNRIASDIHEAVKQFDSVNQNLEVPNVLAFVNYDHDCGINDLYSVWTGKAEPGIDWAVCANMSEGRIRKEKLRIHLFIWFQMNLPFPYLQFTPTHPSHRDTLKALFLKNGITKSSNATSETTPRMTSEAVQN